MQFNVSKRHMRYERCSNEELRIILNNLRFFNLDPNLSIWAFFAYYPQWKSTATVVSESATSCFSSRIHYWREKCVYTVLVLEQNSCYGEDAGISLSSFLFVIGGHSCAKLTHLVCSCLLSTTGKYKRILERREGHICILKYMLGAFFRRFAQMKADQRQCANIRWLYRRCHNFQEDFVVSSSQFETNSFHCVRARIWLVQGTCKV